MNTVLILFLLVVIIFAIIAVVQVFNPNYLIRDSVPLNIFDGGIKGTSSRKVIPEENIDNPGSVRYFYETWIYVNDNSPIYSQNVLFNRGTDFIVTLMGSTLNLFVNAPAAVTINDAGVLDLSNSDIKPLISIPNFPFQKWTQLVINVDSRSVDFYIDGKFVQNAKNNNTINTSSNPIHYANQYTTGRLTRFRRQSISINPQGVWNSYMMGSGQNMSLTNYHVNMQVTKNKQIRVDQRLV
jgi:hypothetical protein